MKKVAFFIALMVGLNATAVVRKPEEEEGQAVVLREEDNNRGKNKISVIHQLTSSILTCFYAITKDGKLDIISWERIVRIFNKESIDIEKDKGNPSAQKTSWVLMNYEVNGDKESVNYKVLEKR